MACIMNPGDALRPTSHVSPEGRPPELAGMDHHLGSKTTSRQIASRNCPKGWRSHATSPPLPCLNIKALRRETRHPHSRDNSFLEGKESPATLENSFPQGDPGAHTPENSFLRGVSSDSTLENSFPAGPPRVHPLENSFLAGGESARAWKTLFQRVAQRPTRRKTLFQGGGNLDTLRKTLFQPRGTLPFLQKTVVSRIATLPFPRKRVF